MKTLISVMWQIVLHPYLTLLVATIFTLGCYILMMRLKRWVDPMPLWKQRLIKIALTVVPIIPGALLADYLYKYLASPLLLFTWPRKDEAMFTYVLTRVTHTTTVTSLDKIALFNASKLCDALDRYDPTGDHCKRRAR